MTRFPDGFLWGAATAGHQVEGGNVNADLWPLEWEEGSRFAEPSGDACDHYHRYPEDIETMATLGLNAYRFSLEWSRIEPERGWFSNAALDHYKRMIGTCLEQGVTPIVSYNHFTTPRWFAGEGGWGSTGAPEHFARFAQRATEHLGDILSWVCTLNEPNGFTLLMTTGRIPLGASAAGAASLTAVSEPSAPAGFAGFDRSRYRMGLVGGTVELMASAHRQAVEAIKSVRPEVKVGWTLALVDLQAAPGGEARWEQARQAAELDWLEVSGDDDFVGVQTYSRDLIGPDGSLPVPDDAPTTQVGWEVYPEALEHTVRLAAERAAVPVLVSENGMATDDDDARIAYTHGALQGLKRCIDDGVDVRGYLHWTYLDNFEWTAGFAPTFGLVAFDRHTFERTVKPSARWLGDVARANELPPGLTSTKETA
jgi:beta-glucosidase